MKKKIIIRLVFTVFLFNSFNVFSQTIVSGGTVSGIWSMLGSPYLIQGNIMVPNDSTLTIEPGVTINFQGTYKLYIQGSVIAIGNATDTILFTSANTTNGWQGIRFDNTPITNDTSEFYYCKIQYGKATISPDDNGGAFYFNNFSKIIISNCLITNCTANSFGGAIFCSHSSPSIKNNTISNNTASDQGGGIYCSYSSPTIFYNTISNNAANYGGGIYCYEDNPNIANNIISNNSATQNGGSIYCTYSHPTITDNTISNNTANAYSGGGIFCNCCSPIITNNIISNNSCGKYGGGICCQSSSSPTITNNIISYNSSGMDGGGIYCFSLSNPATSNNTISNNTATLHGGGIFCFNSCTPTTTNNIISNNTANNGGGIYCDNSNPTFINNTITNNSSVYGGSLYCNNNSDPIIRNTIMWGNTASSSGIQVYLTDEASDPNFYYCDVQGGTTAFGLNGIFFTGTYLNNINSDPLFVLPSGGSGVGFNGVTADWSLQIGSLCINAGNPSGTYPSTDIVGNPRVIDGIIDIGAYEFQGGSSIEAISQDLFSVFPNPVYDNIEIIGLENGKIEIINAHGQIIKTINVLNKKTSVDLSKCATGLYLIKTTFDNRIAVKTIIKQ